jgi:imidazolonepropionase-like amidohydrolase
MGCFPHCAAGVFYFTDSLNFTAMRKLFFGLLLGVSATSGSQVTFPHNGAPFNPHSVYAFTNAGIFVDDETFISNGTLLVQDGKILDVGSAVATPSNAVVINLKGKFVYPSFIDLYSDYGQAVILKSERRQRGPQAESAEKGAYGWNQAIRSHIEAQKTFSHQPEKADELRKNGFGMVLSSVKDGIVRGSGVLVSLNSSKKENQSVISGRAAAFYSFSKGSSTQDYPTSLAGSIALLRQTYYDALWYAGQSASAEYNITLAEFNKLKDLPAVFDAGDKFAVSRAAMIGAEFNVKYIIKGGGNEYQRMHDIKASGHNFILPLNFPDAYDVEDPYDADAVSLAELKHWELAPGNPAAFEKNNIPFCFTAAGLKDINSFLKNLRKAVQAGLSEKAALKALTRNPALFVNAADKAGSLKKGYIASFFIASRPIFEEDAQIMHHWVAGEPFIYAETDVPDIRGNYRLAVTGNTYIVKFSGNAVKPSAQITIDTNKREFTYKLARDLFSFMFTLDSARIYMGSGSYNQREKAFSGNAQLPAGGWSGFTMTYVSPADSQKKEPARKPQLVTGKVIYPFNAFGEDLETDKVPFREAWEKSRAPYEALLIRNTTVWTNSPQGILNKAEVLVVDGLIAAVGTDVGHPKKAGAKVIDGSGMHLTPGIIDEHSHIALTAGVNEAGEASSAEVRMGDVLNPDDINIYRQLAGGVTTSQLLHGSANPIGGQSALIKLRWGLNAEGLKFEKAPAFIKFALGENVKQSNWGDMFNQRFPQTRMGVEQVYNDFFTRAKEYQKDANAEAKKGKSKNLPRRDLELDAISEILAGKRYITCHSYVQSEINMLMKLADSLGFKVNTFTHILEGYKVADKMKAHGANASTFSDWWAYKNEVMEAIPYNTALMTKVGVNTAVNSDDAEMARRLNQEAAKAIKYGALTEEEALKLVTLNPAKMLHIDDKVGSVVPGKSADLVLWTDHPLSVYARADKTIIDGRIYFDRERDAKLRRYVQDERSRLITKMLIEKKKGGKVTKPQAKQPKLYHCNTIEGIDEEITGHR